MATDCLFCRIRDRAITAAIVHEDDQVIAFRDIAPQAPLHLLVIPKRHIPSVKEMTAADTALIGYMHFVGKELATKEGYADKGFRMVINTGSDGGQTVFHLHLHVLAGRRLEWPPG